MPPEGGQPFAHRLAPAEFLQTHLMAQPTPPVQFPATWHMAHLADQLLAPIRLRLSTIMAGSLNELSDPDRHTNDERRTKSYSARLHQEQGGYASRQCAGGRNSCLADFFVPRLSKRD